MADLYRQLLAGLDDLHRPVCELRLEGMEVAEIARQLGVTTRTIDRRLARVRARLADLEAGESRKRQS